MDRALVAIIACTPAGVIGLDGGMPWKLGSDLRRFKSLTMGGTLIMGRKTFDSIGKPLPGRESIVLSRSAPAPGMQIPHLPVPHLPVPHLHWAESLAHVNSVAKSLARPAYVVGGAEIYKLFFPYCTEIWLTQVWSAVRGDTRIDLPLDDFALLEQSRHPQTDRDSVPTTFQKWRRKNSVPKM